MTRVTVTELKNRLSEILRLVKRGETVEVLERSIPIARIEGMAEAVDLADGRLKRLAFEGVVTLARRPPDRDFLDQAPLQSSADPVRALIEERDDR